MRDQLRPEPAPDHRATACATRSGSPSGPAPTSCGWATSGWNTWEEVNRIANIVGRRRRELRLALLRGRRAQQRATTTPTSRPSARTCMPQGPAAVTPPVFAYDHADRSSAARPARPAARRSPAWPSTRRPAARSRPLPRWPVLRRPQPELHLVHAEGHQRPARSRPAAAPSRPARRTRSTSRSARTATCSTSTSTASTIRRIAAVGGANQPPTARIVAHPDSGPAPLTVAVRRADLDAIRRAAPSPTLGPGRRRRLRRLDQRDAVLAVHEPRPGDGRSRGHRPGHPRPGTTTKVVTGRGDEHAAGPDHRDTRRRHDVGCRRPDSRRVLGVGHRHRGREPRARPADLDPGHAALPVQLPHPHRSRRSRASRSGTFFPPDHDYPSYLELTLTATDSGGPQRLGDPSPRPAHGQPLVRDGADRSPADRLGDELDGAVHADRDRWLEDVDQRAAPRRTWAACATPSPAGPTAARRPTMSPRGTDRRIRRRMRPSRPTSR